MSQLPRQSIETLDAPGLATIPVVNSGANQADQLLKVIVGTGYLAGQASQEIRESRQERDRLDAKARAIYLGNGDISGRADYAKELPLINSGQLEFTGDPRAEAEKLIAQRTEGLPEGFAEGYRRAVLDNYTGAIAARQAAVLKQHADQAIPALVSGVYADPSAASMDEARSSYLALSKNHTEQSFNFDVLLPAMRQAAATGTDDAAKRVEDIAGQLSKAGIGQADIDMARIDVIKNRNEIINAKSAAARQSVTEVIRPDVPVTTQLRSLDEATDLKPSDRQELRNQIINLSQTMGEDQVRNAILDGTMPKDEIDRTIRHRAGLPVDHPLHLDPHKAQVLLGSAAEMTDREKAAVDVRRAFGGDRVILTDRHAGAFDDMVGREGAGMIDDTNTVVDGKGLGDAITATNLLTPNTKDTLIANLTGTSPGAVAQSAVTIGAIAERRPRLFAQIVASAGEGTRAMIDKAVEEYKTKRAETDPAASASRIAAAGQSERDQPSPDFASLKYAEDQAGTAKKFNEYLNKLAVDMGGEVPWADDWFFNPAVEGGESVQSDLRLWYTERANQLRTAPDSVRTSEAEKYAKAQLENEYDFVRWNDRISPIRITGEGGVRLPENLRWSALHATEAHADLKAQGISEEDIVGLVPYTNPPIGPGEKAEDKMGWAFLTSSGSILTDDEGHDIVYRPSSAAQNEYASWQKALALKKEEFARSKREYTNPYFAGVPKGR